MHEARARKQWMRCAAALLERARQDGSEAIRSDGWRARKELDESDHGRALEHLEREY